MEAKINGALARIGQIKRELLQLGEMRPGSISQQYNICGNPTCRCKDPVKPRKHGPYHQLSYVWRGRHTTEFVKEEDLAAQEQRLVNFKTFRRLTEEWVGLSIELARLRKQAQGKGKGRR
jgi:hypothetical protein